MILIDAIYINNSGGKILLDYLIEQLELTNLSIFYLLDKRVEDNHPVIKPENRIQFLDGSLFQKYRFYRVHGNDFTKILCFGNLPPNIRLKPKVYTYFHQLLFLKTPKELTFKTRFLISLKKTVFKLFVKNSDFWIVQSKAVKELLLKKHKQIAEKQILILPFYPTLNKISEVSRKKNKFIYISSGHLYKNHIRLLHAFSAFYDKHKLGELHLTIENEFAELNNMIKVLQNKGYPIVNHGFVNRVKLAEIYQSAEFTIYPSMAESFGLGIIEAIENGCKVIASDLPWFHAVCKTSCVFDPRSEDSILFAIEKSVFEDLKVGKKLVYNEIEQIINLLK